MAIFLSTSFLSAARLHRSSAHHVIEMRVVYSSKIGNDCDKKTKISSDTVKSSHKPTTTQTYGTEEVYTSKYVYNVYNVLKHTYTTTSTKDLALTMLADTFFN